MSLKCDALQSGECNIFGGSWGGGSKFVMNCAKCQVETASLREPKVALNLSEFGPPEKRPVKISLPSSLEGLLSFEFDSMPVGVLAGDTVRNMHMVETFAVLRDPEKLVARQIRNLVSLSEAYRGALSEIEPKAIVSNDSHYGMWRILQLQSERHEIPFFSLWPLNSNSRSQVAFRKNTYAMNPNVPTDIWNRVAARPMSSTERAGVDAWLNRAPRSGERLESKGVAANAESLISKGRAVPVPDNRPMALLAANVVWDLASLNRQRVFVSMVDWVIETVRWFCERPQYRLVVRPHTTESSSVLPGTKETIASALSKAFEKLPHNIFLDSDAEGPIYDWIEMASCVLVNTSTVGLEAACMGKPVIATGQAPYSDKNIALDPLDADEYFNLVSTHLTSHGTSNLVRVQNAYKFADFYLNDLRIDHDLFKSETWNEPELLVSRLSDILPGRNPNLDVIVEAIQFGRDPLYDPTRNWNR